MQGGKSSNVQVSVRVINSTELQGEELGTWWKNVEK